MAWTNEQNLAIYESGKNIIVSAGLSYSPSRAKRLVNKNVKAIRKNSTFVRYNVSAVSSDHKYETPLYIKNANNRTSSVLTKNFSSFLCIVARIYMIIMPQIKYRLYDLNVIPSPRTTNTNINAASRKRLIDIFNAKTLLFIMLFRLLFSDNQSIWR